MGAQRGQKYFSDLLEVELKGFVNCSRWSFAKIQTGSSG